jgi:predicted DNA-binding transcriptional regulator AlpA
MGMPAVTNEERTASPETPLLLLSAETLANCLQISLRTLWRMRSAGRLPPPIRLGGAVRWRAADIEAWVAAGCPESPLKDEAQRRIPR